MDLAKAQALAIGATVRCPADRGEPAYSGTVQQVGATVRITITGQAYVWVDVRRKDGRASVWPSNRLEP